MGRTHMAGRGSEMALRPIGVVRSAIKTRKDARDRALKAQPARLEVSPALRDGLDGLAPGDRVLVLFWLHLMEDDEREVLRVHPGGDRDKPMRGVFATRSPARPNPIGATTVEVVSRERDVLVVKGLDAVDGSPVLDIKIAV